MRNQPSAYRPPFPADPRADQRARPGLAGDRVSDDRPSRPGVRRARQGDRRRHAVFQTEGTVVIYPSSGTGAWEAALVNTLSPGDRVLMFETGHFATLWRQMATRLGLEVEFVPGDWRHGVDPALVDEKLDRRPRAPDQGGLRRAQRDLDRGHQPHRRDPRGDRRGAPPGAVDGRHDLLARLDRLPARRVGGRRHGRRLAEGADAAAGARLQRGLRKRRSPHRRRAKLPRSYWDWEAMLGDRADRLLSRTRRRPTCCSGCARRLTMLLDEEGLPAVFRRHARHAEATRRAVAGWGLEVLCADPREYSNSLTAVAGARRARCRPAARDHSRRLRHVARHRARQDEGQDLPHRPSRPFQRSDAVRHAVRRRDGAAPRRHPAPRRRRRRGAGISRRRPGGV